MDSGQKPKVFCRLRCRVSHFRSLLSDPIPWVPRCPFNTRRMHHLDHRQGCMEKLGGGGGGRAYPQRWGGDPPHTAPRNKKKFGTLRRRKIMTPKSGPWKYSKAWWGGVRRPTRMGVWGPNPPPKDFGNCRTALIMGYGRS